MTPEQILEIYRQALVATERMLEAARANDWDGLVRLEQERDQLIEAARHHDTEPPKSGEARQRKRELIQRILEQDQEVKALTQDWMRELREILSSMNNTQKLNKTYSQS